MNSMPDLEAGGGDEDEWSGDDDWGPPSGGGGSGGGGASASSPGGVSVEEEEEPEPDPFAGMDMAPKIQATKRHQAQSVWAKPAASTSSVFAMTDDAGADGWGADDDLGDTLGVNEKRKAAEQRREQRRRERGDSGARDKPRSGRLAATKGAEF